jgi:hypothetical protein
MALTAHGTKHAKNKDNNNFFIQIPWVKSEQKVEQNLIYKLIPDSIKVKILSSKRLYIFPSNHI